MKEKRAFLFSQTPQTFFNKKPPLKNEQNIIWSCITQLKHMNTCPTTESFFLACLTHSETMAFCCSTMMMFVVLQFLTHET